jgi:hypothetical protein
LRRVILVSSVSGPQIALAEHSHVARSYFCSL